MKNIEFNGKKFKIYTEEQFVNLETCDDKRYIGIESENNIIKGIIVIDQNYINKNNINYLDLHQKLKSFSFYVQKSNQDCNITIEDNLELIQKHFEQCKLKKNIPLLDSNKSKKSYKHL